ncbi:hypothetical protein [Derxia gummosa]|uniref:Uncharacterized protein n=1 Tax=Derxia gummosa DSM 723 TaxID=1121388 RepID=A0A8B6X0S0_9BURK|nr:hypothetical protein [Derxia gummosa]
MQVADAPKEITQALSHDLVYDDDGNDVRETGVLPPFGKGGAGDDSYTFYRLWDGPGEDADSGMQFQVFPDGRVIMKNIDPYDD